MADLEKLVADHAYWSDKIRELKKAGSFNYFECIKISAKKNKKPCIDAAIEHLNQTREENPHDSYSFEEIWENLDCEGDICQHCKNVRHLKKRRVMASRKLGGIRAAITRVGRRLNAEEEKI